MSVISQRFISPVTANFRLVSPPPSRVFRIARDPWVPPPWDYATNITLPKTFGGRFDDPSGRWGVPIDGRYRTLYCTTERIGAFAETASQFRVKLPELMQRVRGFVKDAGEDEAMQFRERGAIQRDWLGKKRIGSTLLDASLRFIDLESSQTLQTLNRVPRLAHLAVRLGLDEIDRRVLVLRDEYMRLSQEIGYWAYHQLDDRGNPIAGVRYLSRVGGEWECWGLFDTRVAGWHGPSFAEAISSTDPDLHAVASIFALDIEVLPGQYISP